MITWKVDRSLLKEPFASNVDALLSADPADWIVTSGYRSPDEQTALYAEGRDNQGNIVTPSAVVTNAKAGQSAHNAGLAVDVTLVKDGKDDWDVRDPDWQRMIAAVRAAPDLHSGADFPTPDTDHIEAYRWKAIRNAQSA